MGTDKIVFDSYEPSAGCFDPPPTNPSVTDKCTVEGSFHDSGSPDAPQPKAVFQREKDHYIYSPGTSAAPVLQGVGFNEKSPAFQSTLGFAVFLNQWFRGNYPGFKSAKSYKGPDLLPPSMRTASFIALGNIVDPDATQRKTTSTLLREILLSDADGKLWFKSMFESLLDPDRNLKVTPEPMRPRVQFLSDQIKLYEDLTAGFSAIKGEDDETSALRANLTSWTVDLLDHLTTGEKPLKDLKAALDLRAAEAFRSTATPKDLKDLFSFVSKKLHGLEAQAFYQNNADAKKRLALLQAYLKEAVNDHRAELLGLDPNAAFKKSLYYRLADASKRGLLANRVKSELNNADMAPEWIQENFESLANAVLPHLSLVQTKGFSPRVKVNVAEIQKNMEKADKEHAVGTLAVLRYLFGPTLGDFKMEGWVGDRYTDIEINLSETQAKELMALNRGKGGKNINLDIGTTYVLPITEGSILAGGLGLGIYGFVPKNDRPASHPNAFAWSGATMVGAGGGALLCHYVWKSKNRYLTDGVCAIAGGLLGAGIYGLSTGWLDRSGTGNPPGNNPPIDGRNPVTPWGP